MTKSPLRRTDDRQPPSSSSAGCPFTLASLPAANAHRREIALKRPTFRNYRLWVAQNIYDDETFASNYAQLPRSVLGLDGAPEWPTLRAMIGGVRGDRVVDLGCGYGWFCRWAAEAGAETVVGLDISTRMLGRAVAETDDVRITYQQANLEDFELGENAFDVAYSSLTFHYLVELTSLLRRLHAALAPGGRLVFSVEHPIFTAPSAPGFVPDVGGKMVWPVDSYLDEGARTTSWLAPGVVKQHRTIATYLSSLRAARFGLVDLIEWGPSDDQVAEVPDWASERDRPPFLLISARAEVD